MTCECLIVGSDTAPVRNAVADGENGLLVDFFDYAGLADALIAACSSTERFQPLRQAARRTIKTRQDRAAICLPAWMELIEGQLARGTGGDVGRW